MKLTPQSDFWDEGRWSKLLRRLKEEPLVPVGLALTCYALYGATRSIRAGDKEQTNRYFRARVYAQGFTLLCVCVGAIYWKEDREKRKQFQGLLSDKRAKEKRDAWIRELEIRDQIEEEERGLRRVRKQEREAARMAALETKASEADNNAALSGSDMRSLLVRSDILGPAMKLWWSRS